MPSHELIFKHQRLDGVATPVVSIPPKALVLPDGVWCCVRKPRRKSGGHALGAIGHLGRDGTGGWIYLTQENPTKMGVDLWQAFASTRFIIQRNTAPSCFGLNFEKAFFVGPIWPGRSRCREKDLENKLAYFEHKLQEFGVSKVCCWQMTCWLMLVKRQMIRPQKGVLYLQV